jgi:hypothetical protein
MRLVHDEYPTMADNSVACELFDDQPRVAAQQTTSSDEGESIDRDIDERYLGEPAQ